MSQLSDYQEEITEWVIRNFGNDSILATVGGVCEEAGELMRAAIKKDQGIRGTDEEWFQELRKEAADVYIKLNDVAQFYGFSLEDAISERWSEIRLRDWTKDKVGHGLPS